MSHNIICCGPQIKLGFPRRKHEYTHIYLLGRHNNKNVNKFIYIMRVGSIIEMKCYVVLKIEWKMQRKVCVFVCICVCLCVKLKFLLRFFFHTVHINRVYVVAYNLLQYIAFGNSHQK